MEAPSIRQIDYCGYVCLCALASVLRSTAHEKGPKSCHKVYIMSLLSIYKQNLTNFVYNENVRRMLRSKNVRYRKRYGVFRIPTALCIIHEACTISEASTLELSPVEAQKILVSVLLHGMYTA